MYVTAASHFWLLCGDDVLEGNGVVKMVHLFPLFFFAIILHAVYRTEKANSFRGGIFLLMIFSLVMAMNLNEFNLRKERSEREVYADQLATEKDALTELEYSKISAKIKDDNFLKKLILSKTKLEQNDFTDGLERRFFNNYWERYELNFFLFDNQDKLVYRGQLDDSRPGNGIPLSGSDLRGAIDSVLYNRTVNPNQKPSIGCNIKWKK